MSPDLFKEGMAMTEHPVCWGEKTCQRQWDGEDICLRTWLELCDRNDLPHWEYGWNWFVQATGPPCWVIKEEDQDLDMKCLFRASALKCLSGGYNGQSSIVLTVKGEMSNGCGSSITGCWKTPNCWNTFENRCNMLITYQECFHLSLSPVFSFYIWMIIVGFCKTFSWKRFYSKFRKSLQRTLQWNFLRCE